MFKVNLETELRNQPESIVTAKELLLIREYENVGADVNAEQILSRIGINKSSLKGKSIQYTLQQHKHEASQFAANKVYHISQIEKLCHKYALRFLPAANFKGSIPSELADKISTFETTYGVQCESHEETRWGNQKESNTFIVAPASSFNLQERPKDPLLFYKVNENYYYLIHKWGDDLHLSRRIISVFRNKALHSSIILILISSLAFLLRNTVVVGKHEDQVPILTLIVTIFGIIFLVVYIFADSEANIFGNKSDWRSPFK